MSDRGLDWWRFCSPAFARRGGEKHGPYRGRIHDRASSPALFPGDPHSRRSPAPRVFARTRRSSLPPLNPGLPYGRRHPTGRGGGGLQAQHAALSRSCDPPPPQTEFQDRQWFPESPAFPRILKGGPAPDGPALPPHPLDGPAPARTEERGGGRVGEWEGIARRCPRGWEPLLASLELRTRVL